MIQTRILREYRQTRTYRVPRCTTCPLRVRTSICSESDLTRDMENPMSGYIIETRRAMTRKFSYTFRFAANYNVPYTSTQSVSLCLSFHVFLKIVFSTVVRIVSLGVLVPKFHGTRRIDLYSRTQFQVLKIARAVGECNLRT